MATSQDPLLDNWTTHEKLCLANIVSSIGDKNWIDISRNMKILCENNTDGLRRPSDWYSEESCALQYAHLLENGEDSKNKQRSSEGNSGSTSPAAEVQTPFKRLKDKRIKELQEQIRKDQEEYAKIHEALQKLKSPNKTLEMLQDMWQEVEKEQEATRIREMKWENELREREQRKQENQLNWQTGSGTNTTTTTTTTTAVKQENTAIVEMDVEGIIGVSKPMQTATSPLLSSLLKSQTAPTAPPPSSARASAPTITTLLTSGTIPKSSQPAITLNTDLIPPEKAVQLLSRPISGPPSGDSLNVSNTAALNLLRPSKSAPTLSMLLEKNKKTSVGNNQQVSCSSSNDEIKSSMPNSKSEHINEPKPMEDEEKANVPKTKGENHSDEPDPNEEQQLMEVFKNIGNIELDIDVAAVIDDEEVDFLKGVEEESTRNTVEADEFENKMDKKGENATTESKIEIEKMDKDSSKTMVPEKSTLEQNPLKMETSSDDSNDNIPLAALENKERVASTPTENDAKPSDDNPKSSNLSSEDKSPIARPAKDEAIEKLDTKETEEQQDNLEIVEKIDAAEIKCEEDINSLESKVKQEPNGEEKANEVEVERFSSSTGDENIKELGSPSTMYEDSKPDVNRVDNDNAVDNSTTAATIRTGELIATESNSDSTQMQENANTNETTLPPPPKSQNSVADTDEDSCMTDISVITTTTKREEKQTTPETRQKAERAASQTRRLGTHDVSSKSTEDSDSSSGHRASKRSLLSILNNLSTTESGQTIQQGLNDEETNSKYQRNCYKRLDFQTIKKSIESGSIRSFIDLQRDLLHFVQNVNFSFHSTSPTYKAAEVFKHEMQNIREFVFNAHEFEAKTEKEVKEIKQAATKQGRTGSRKSLRIS